MAARGSSCAKAVVSSSFESHGWCHVLEGGPPTAYESPTAAMWRGGRLVSCAHIDVLRRWRVCSVFAMGKRRRRGQIPRQETARAPYRYARRVSDHEFVQRVRQYTPSSLVPLIASKAAETAFERGYLRQGQTHWAPWGLAEVARVSITRGSELNRKEATLDDLISCLAAYQGLDDPGLHRGSPGSAWSFFLRLGALQLGYQQSPKNDLGRTAALFTQTTPTRELSVIRGDWADQLLGCSLQEFAGTAVLLQASAWRNAGTFDVAWIGQPQFGDILRDVPAERLRHIIENLYTASCDVLRALQTSAYRRSGTPKPDYRRFSFNPLDARPVVSGISDRLFIPVPQLVTRRASPLGVFHEGIRRWNEAFSRDIGNLFEAYVGRHLALIPNTSVLPEFTYGKDKRLSVDWWLITQDAVVLVEVKATRPTESIRSGSESISDDLRDRLHRAVEQLDTSASLIDLNHPEVPGAIPRDKPMVGLVVTMEPFHAVSENTTTGVFPTCRIPWALSSAVELEDLVTVGDVPVGKLLLDHLTDPSKIGYPIKSALVGHEPAGENKIIQQGWDSFPWAGSVDQELQPQRSPDSEEPSR